MLLAQSEVMNVCFQLQNVERQIEVSVFCQDSLPPAVDGSALDLVMFTPVEDHGGAMRAAKKFFPTNQSKKNFHDVATIKNRYKIIDFVYRSTK